MILRDWTPRGLKLFLNFTEPLYISQSVELDKVSIRFKKPEVFVDSESLAALEVSDLELTTVIPL